MTNPSRLTDDWVWVQILPYSQSQVGNDF